MRSGKRGHANVSILFSGRRVLYPNPALRFFEGAPQTEHKAGSAQSGNDASSWRLRSGADRWVLRNGASSRALPPPHRYGRQQNTLPRDPAGVALLPPRLGRRVRDHRPVEPHRSAKYSWRPVPRKFKLEHIDDTVRRLRLFLTAPLLRVWFYRVRPQFIHRHA